MIETERLILRNWRDEDAEAYADILTDPRVYDWLAGPFTRADAYDRIAKGRVMIAEEGLGRMAIERKADGRLLGHCGLARAAAGPPMPDGLEVGWALAPEAWGAGYATEAAQAVIADGFSRHKVTEILAFTGETNTRSQGVMRRLGMIRTPERDFEHPMLADEHPLKRHIVFVGRP